MKLNRWLVGIIIGTQFALAARAADDADIQTLKQQIQELDQKIRILEREREIDQDGVAAAAKTTPKISLGGNGIVFSSADSNFVVQIHGVAQFDSRSFFHDSGINGNDGLLLRRARPILSGTVYHDFDYNLTPEFGGGTVQILDAYLNYRYRPELQVQAGKFKSPIGLEQLQSDPNTTFNERSLATMLVPNRDLGLELHGELADGVASYAVGVFNGAPDYSSTSTNAPFQDDKAGVARGFIQPWKHSGVNGLRGLGFGLAGSFEANHPNTNSATGLTPGYVTDGQQKFFSYAAGVNARGAQWRLAPQASYYYGPLGLLGEYVISDQRVAATGQAVDLRNTAWEITGTWLLTGEDATFNGVTPLHPFDPRNHQWGAWQLAARYGELSVDNHVFAGGLSDSTKYASGARAWSVGLDWFLNRNIRANLSYSRTTFSGFTGTTPSSSNPAAQPENVLFSRLQIAF